ncbi:sensor histidine kinase [Siminovitchia fortis]|uniref:Sensor histidine kinase n=1 Tax=Siminovitchia fortis TaxID=254758 RepID=A0A443ILJ1_9BACI|nr:sensor histidine kinase [Siminovitchia fortis]
MVSYENFFLFILISILCPVIGVLILIIFNAFEKQIYLLEVENSKVLLEKELETTKYVRLNQQIQPHFLFNALNSMFGLIRLKKYDRLEETFEHMVLYLRSKYDQEKTLYTLKEEIEYTNHFLAIQQLRFGGRLRVEWDVEDGIEEILIVPYLIQTLVENAFKHGIENLEGPGIVRIIIQSTKHRVSIIVEDNGPGFAFNPLEEESGIGIGLNNVSKRLHLLFGEEADMDFSLNGQQEKRGGRVIVSFPKVFERVELGGGKYNEHSYSG